ncbi:DNA ligase 1-like [Belonocnema kinseyi]|uniref:DNA ligase 1-like n=1 Tax=Belonocnema kinseyi TaxID=2817044 RepID=UPI00143CD0A3|nr:DNA ligase 1-like [Belonocnema kinseyi]
MGKAEVNQEIILMRPIVRKARVRIIRSLIREINILKVKRGDEKKLIKFKRRANRFREEVEAAKKIKDDEVSDFGLVNTRSLYSILDDVTSDAHTRVIAKFADFPELKQRIAEFKQKFPDYEQFLGPGKKKLARLEYEKRAEFIEEKRQKQTKEKEQKKKLKEVMANSSENITDDEIENESLIKNEEENKDDVDEEEKAEDEQEEEEDEDEQEEEEEESEDDGEDENSEEMEEDSESELPLKPNLKSKKIRELKPQSDSEDTSESETEEKVTKQVPRPSKKEKSVSKRKAEKIKSCEPESEAEEEEPVRKKLSKKVSESLKDSKIMINKLAPIISGPPRKRKLNTKEIKTVTKEATVKRFSEFLQEEAQELEEEFEQKIPEKIKRKSKTQKEEVKKEVDSFFMTADGSHEYLRVVVPKKIENSNLPTHNLDHANPQEGRDFLRKGSDKNNTSFTNMNKFEERPNKFRGDNTWNKDNSSSKFKSRMEKRGYEKNNPRDRNNASSKFGPRAEKGRGIEARSADKFGNKFEKKSVTSDEHLHPSWAAKKKQQNALKLGFQGKKIVFRD